MMQLFNLIFLACAGIIGLAIFLTIWFLIVWLMCRKKFLPQRLLLMCLGVPIYVLLVGGLLWHAWQPSTVFNDAFGFAPPPDVQNLRSESFILGDGGRVDMMFACSQATITKIVAMGMTLETSPTSLATQDLPTWWTSRPSPNAAVYSGLTRKQSFTAEQAVLIFDPVTSTAYYRWQGVD